MFNLFVQAYATHFFGIGFSECESTILTLDFVCWSTADTMKVAIHGMPLTSGSSRGLSTTSPIANKVFSVPKKKILVHQVCRGNAQIQKMQNLKWKENVPLGEECWKTWRAAAARSGFFLFSPVPDRLIHSL